MNCCFDNNDTKLKFPTFKVFLKITMKPYREVLKKHGTLVWKNADRSEPWLGDTDNDNAAKFVPFSSFVQ